MKKLAAVITCFLILSFVSAQNKLPSFHKIDITDLQMTDCSFDKGAEALKLIDYGSMHYDRGTTAMTLFKTVYDYRVRIKILKDKGLSYANVEIPFYSNNNDEKISNVDACTYNLDEGGKVKITDVNKSSIYTKKFNKRFSRLIIAFPEVKVGSVIEYRYKLERDAFTAIKGWLFQDFIPTRYSEFEVKIPRLFSFKPQPSIVDSVEVKEKENDEVFNIENDSYSFKVLDQDFIMRNLVGIRNEPFMAAAKDYQQRIEFFLSQVDHGNNNIENIRATWVDVMKDLYKDEDFGQQVSKDIPDLMPLINQAQAIQDKYARANFLYNAIRSKMNCKDHEALFTDEGVEAAWRKKSGNIADINLLLVNCLNKAGINAYPILMSTRDNGLPNTTYYSLNQFNVVMAYMQLNDGFLVLDASDKVSNYKLTPKDIVNTRGFVADREFGKWVDIINNTHKYDVMVALQGSIDEQGNMKGECSVLCSGYARKQRMESYLKNVTDFKNDYFIKPYPAVAINDIVFTNTETDSLPLSQKINFTMPLNNSGAYSYFNTNMFNDIEKNPFIAKERVADIDFGFQQQYVIYGNFTIPEGYTYDALPQDVSISALQRGLQYSRVMTVSGNTLNMKFTVDFHKPFYTATDYAEFYEFYKKLMNSLDEQVVIKKKS